MHIGALGGLWQAVVFGFAGLNLNQDDPLTIPDFRLVGSDFPCASITVDVGTT